MSLWEDALLEQRRKRSQQLYERLGDIGWDNLSPVDRALHEVLGWFCMEIDSDPKERIEADLGD